MSSLNHHELTVIKCKCQGTIKIKLYTLRRFAAVHYFTVMFFNDSIECPPTLHFVMRLSVTQIAGDFMKSYINHESQKVSEMVHDKSCRSNREKIMHPYMIITATLLI